ncbi:MAG: helix-turn-helix domain-containing protein, partial [Candidatus Hodarchaeota archaeon]
MGKNKTGRRYSEQEKYEILNYLQNHTYKDTSAFFNISEQTLARWKRSLSLSVSDQNAKIVLGIPSYWLDYLNDKIAQNVWENYDDAILNIIKSYDRTQKSLGSVQDDNEFISQLSVILEELIENNPEIDAILARNRISIEFQSKLWPSSEVNPLLKGWNRFLTHEKESVVNFAGMKYIITYGIPEQIVYAKSHKNSTGMKKIANDYICGVRKEFSRNTWYFFALVNT